MSCGRFKAPALSFGMEKDKGEEGRGGERESGEEGRGK